MVSYGSENVSVTNDTDIKSSYFISRLSVESFSEEILGPFFVLGRHGWMPLNHTMRSSEGLHNIFITHAVENIEFDTAVVALPTGNADLLGVYALKGTGNVS